MSHPKRAVLILSIVIFVVTLIASLGGVLFPEIYQDNATFVLIWQSNDWITLLVALPIMAISVGVWLKTHTLKSLLVWFSILWYLCYNYAYYVYGAAFNAFYLLHLFIYTLSILALVLGLTKFPVKEIDSSIQPTLPRKVLMGEMLFVSFGLTVIYVLQSLAFVLNGTIPAIITASGHVTSVVFTIDMTMVVLFFVLGSVLLAKKNPWGYVLAFLGHFKGAIYMAVLIFASVRTNLSEAPLWIVLELLMLGSVLLLWIGLKNKPLLDSETR